MKQTLYLQYVVIHIVIRWCSQWFVALPEICCFGLCFQKRVGGLGSHKIIVFLGVVVSLVLVIGSLMYLIEGEENGFTSIPRAI